MEKGIRGRNEQSSHDIVLAPVGSELGERALEVAAIHMRAGVAPVEALLLTAEAMFGMKACTIARMRLVKARGFADAG